MNRLTNRLITSLGYYYMRIFYSREKVCRRRHESSSQVDFTWPK